MKPHYKVPSMEEIRSVPSNGLTVISTFSGTGGSCLGFKMAGFDVLWANEFVESARECYSLNFPGTSLDPRDIRVITVEDILSVTGLKVGELDVFEGSPPCASFSTAGRRHEGWGKVRKYSDTKQRTDDLFFEYARLLKGLQPKVFLAENVSGLVKGVAKGYFKTILNELRDCGYTVEARLLDAQWLGVPQRRQRIFFMGVRRDFNFGPSFPPPFPYRFSTRDAIGDLQEVRPERWQAVEDTKGIWGRSDITDVPSTTVRASGVAYPRVATLEGTAIGAEALKLGEGEASDKYLNLTRASRNLPSPTVTAVGGPRGVASVIHPTEERKFSIDELKRICAFPDDFQLLGGYAKQWERLGRSVPPLMMFAVAKTIRDEVLPKCAG